VVYDPEFDERVRTTSSGSQGKVSNSYTIVPAFRGKYPIPPISFSYFDPKTEKYNTISSDEIIINVTSGPANTSGPSAVAGSNTKQAVVAKGDQFGFIKLSSTLLPINKSRCHGW